MSVWHQIIRTGNVENDQRMLDQARAHATGQGLVLQVTPLPEGGFQVVAVSPYAAPAGASNALAPQTGGRAVAAGEHCDACMRRAPTKNVTFMQNVGLLVIRFPKTLKGNLCRLCVSRFFWRYTLITFFFGWWGVISFFYSLVSIPVNIANFLSARKLPVEFERA